MGYTHYFELSNQPCAEGWAHFIKGANQLLEQAWDIDTEHELTTDFISINGIGDESHETFFLSKSNIDWEFCKTARKPYDNVVTAVLILAKYLFPSMYLRSDGSWGDWIEGRELFESVFHLTPAENTVFDKVESRA